MTDESEKRVRVLRQEMETVRAQNEKRIATLTQSNRALSDKISAKQGSKEAQLVGGKGAGVRLCVCICSRLASRHAWTVQRIAVQQRKRAAQG